jgi:hypothetical protein
LTTAFEHEASYSLLEQSDISNILLLPQEKYHTSLVCMVVVSDARSIHVNTGLNNDRDSGMMVDIHLANSTFHIPQQMNVLKNSVLSTGLFTSVQ